MVIDLCAEMFESATSRRTKGVVKLTACSTMTAMPNAVVVTEGKRHEVTVAC